MKKIHKPTGDYPSFYQPYMNCVPGDGDLIEHLKAVQLETEELVRDLSEEQLAFSYATGKWTIKDILLHLADCERVLIYRAMRIARGDKTELPGFDENLFSLSANAGKRETPAIINELKCFRAASITFIETLTEEELDRTGTANGFILSTRLLVNHICGHHQHHMNIIREKYL